MSSENPAANWAVAKRFLHWGIAIAVVTALLAPKPEDNEGLLHIAAGTTALALVLVRVCWRLFGGVRPYLRDALKIKAPDFARGARGLAPFLLQAGRLIGFLFLAMIPLAAGLALAGIGQGEDSPLLEAHEAAGTAVMVLAIAHATAIIGFALLMKYNLVGVTFAGPARALGEGGARGYWGMALGALLGVAVLSYVWGPFDVAGKAAALEESEGGEHGEAGGYEDD